MHYYFKDQIDRADRRNVYLFLFLLIWLVINLIQSAFTELAHDEAYYWVYSQSLDWGYFDHPPMIALLIKAGYFLIHNELGVRLFTSILGTASLLIIYRLIDAKDKSLWLFILIVSSIIIVNSHVGGFLAIPDIPLIFSTCIFFIFYKRYIDHQSYLLAFLLGIAAALMLYSKYHGFLVLGFTLFANLKIIRKPSFWIIPLVCGILLIPHISWQVKNGYPSLVYHLFTRSSAYKPEHTINFLYSQLLIAGPFVSVIVLYRAFTFRIQSEFERILKINLIGIFSFFFLSSFKGHVEAHWTAIAYIPLIILTYKGCAMHQRSMRWLQRLFLPSILLFLFIRVILIFDILPLKINPVYEMHDWKKWAAQVDSMGNGRPVVFVNSFQRPSKYSFYTNGRPAYTLNDVYYRKNQYDLWPIEDSLQNKPVLLMYSRVAEDTMITVNGEKYPYQAIDSFTSYFNLRITVDNPRLKIRAGDTISLEAMIINPRKSEICFTRDDRITAVYHTGRKFLKEKPVKSLQDIIIPPKSSLPVLLDIPTPDVPGKYSLYISIATQSLRPALNANPVRVRME